jgi:glycosyltransferase involved in cell wall biosynthesis
LKNQSAIKYMLGQIKQSSLSLSRRYRLNISVVIPTYNSEETIESCLVSLHHQTYPPREVTVVDGGSTDSTLNKIQKVPNVQVILARGCPPGSSKNKGVAAAVSEIIFFCDSDCIIDQKALEYHIKGYQTRSDMVGVMGTKRSAGERTKISNFVQRQIISSEWVNNLEEDGTISTYLDGANLSIKREEFLRERFNEDLISCEDTELFIRLKKNRMKILFEPRAIVYHHHPRTIQRLFKRFKWYGEGFYHLDRIHREYFRSRYTVLSPIRYLLFKEDYLKRAVMSNNKLLCNSCKFDAFQKCKILNPKLLTTDLKSNIDLHRITCLAIATGILKQRTGIDYTPFQSQKNPVSHS